jgi:hypothetical protein
MDTKNDLHHIPPNHILLDRSPTIGPLGSCWKLENSIQAKIAEIAETNALEPQKS